MNSVHDMGGMHNMGPIEREANEPVFHHPWEGRVYAMTRALRTRDGLWCLDAHRHEIEKLPPAEYLRLSYYERWFEVLTGQLAAAPPTELRLTAQAAGETMDRRPSARRDAPATPHFKAGQKVRARNIHPGGHTRLPRYARGKTGVVARDRGVYVFPDAHAHDRGDGAQHLYSVRFTARELWGDAASPRDSVYLDLWDDYLERA